MNKEIKFGRNAVKKNGSARLQIKPNSFLISLFTICFILASIYHFTKTHQDTKFSLTFPVKCQLEINCIIQHLPDLDPGEGVKDPFGDVNTFNNHNGLDIRVISVEAMNKGVDIVAAADGIVIKKSDILPDRFLRTKAEMRIAQKNRCGNYIVISHQEGFETIYCQLKQNSVVVEAGDKVSAGETIANLGYSGFARWPHLHFTLKKNGKWIDAIFGNEPGIPIANNTESLFEDKYLASLNNAGLRLLGSGISSRKVSLYDLNSNGHPKNAELTSNSVNGWAWYNNLQLGDKIELRLIGPDGVLSSKVSNPNTYKRGRWVYQTGFHSISKTGKYYLYSRVIRNNKKLAEQTVEHFLEPRIKDKIKSTFKIIRKIPSECHPIKGTQYDLYASCSASGEEIRVIQSSNLDRCERSCTGENNCVSWELKYSQCRLLSSSKTLYSGFGTVGTNKNKII